MGTRAETSRRSRSRRRLRAPPPATRRAFVARGGPRVRQPGVLGHRAPGVRPGGGRDGAGKAGGSSGGGSSAAASAGQARGLGLGLGLGLGSGRTAGCRRLARLRACLGVVTTALSSRRPPSVHVLVAVLASVTSVTSLAAKGAFAVDGAARRGRRFFSSRRTAASSRWRSLARGRSRRGCSPARGGSRPPEARLPDRSDDAVVGGGATWRVRPRSRELTRAETSRWPHSPTRCTSLWRSTPNRTPPGGDAGWGNDAYARGGGGSFERRGRGRGVLVAAAGGVW